MGNWGNANQQWTCSEFRGQNVISSNNDKPLDAGVVCSTYSKWPEKQNFNGKAHSYITNYNCGNHRTQNSARKTTERDPSLVSKSLMTNSQINNLRQIIVTEYNDRKKHTFYKKEQNYPNSINYGDVISCSDNNNLNNVISALNKECVDIAKDNEKKTEDNTNLSVQIDKLVTNEVSTVAFLSSILPTHIAISAAITDCICYSDCGGFGMCNCYGYCSCNYSDRRIKHDIKYL